MRRLAGIVAALLVAAGVLLAAAPAGAVPQVFCQVGYHRVLKPHPVPHFVCKRDKPN